MVYPDNILKLNVSQVVSPLVSPILTKVVDIREHFENGEEFEFHDDMLHWIRTETMKLGFGVVIGRSDNSTSRRNAFVTLTCERNGKYICRIQKLKLDDNDSRKCKCSFKLCGYHLANNKWRFNVICGLHNHDLSQKLVGHPIACWLLPDEKICVFDMNLSLVPPKNNLATLKRKRSGNTSNIKQVYNRRYQEKVEEIYNALVPSVSEFAPEEKWMCFSELGHLIAGAYERHFVQVYLKLGCPIPPTSLEWAIHFTMSSETWPDQFIERMQDYNKLNKMEIEKK
ncbi:uncharacterized protein LOC131621371 [Vicia villosa]|uniref:uncharacterized protein LOC131621371 n=1 Tax=Vicia villosa TaxID=3911 RepID=UPI00273C9220|nr:uncharacterized protein LOC131621371 [Vicia villosa]